VKIVEIEDLVEDLFINEPTPASEWFEGAVLDYLPAAVVRGENGIYLAHVPLAAMAIEAVATIEAGVNAERIDSRVTGGDELVNELTVRWARARDLRNYFQTRILSSAYQKVIAVPGGGTYSDTRTLPDALCAVSQRVYGARPGTVELPTVYAQATALRIGHDRVLRLALPERTFTYSVSLDQYRRHPGDVVLLVDAEWSIPGVLCTVVDVIVQLTRVVLALRPLRGLDSYL
jgi:hypothetical protein